MKSHFLIERIRIHDFHRFGVLPPGKNIHTIFLGGPVKITAQSGSGAAWVSESGIEVSVGGNSNVKLQRPLLVENGKFFDDESMAYVSLDDLVAGFLKDVPAVITEVEALVA